MHTHTFSIFLYYFLFFIFFINSFWGWAQLSQHGLGPHEARVIQITRAWPLLLNSKQAAKMN
jgi:hypothetical protein